VNAPLIAAGCLATLGAAVHGVAGEVLVVRKLSPSMLPSSRFGGPRATMAMIHASWHLTTVAFLTVGAALLLSGSVLHGDTARAMALLLTTVAFLTVGAALLLSGSVLHGDTARAMALLAAGAATGFAAVVLVLGAASGEPPRLLFRHPGPPLLTATAALAWWGAL
jgi:hypothetical protein